MDKYSSLVPLAWYFDGQLTTAVKQSFFTSDYAGSGAMVPNLGDYAALPHHNYETLLVQNPAGHTQLSNRCRHKRSLIVDPIHRRDSATGNVGPQKRLVCPVHCWSYGLDGKNLGTPFFDQAPLVAGATLDSLDLPGESLVNWQGLLFTGGRPMTNEMRHFGHSQLFDPALFNLAEYDFVQWEIENYACSWLVFMDVYFDLYHVAPYHRRTFNQLVDTATMEWEFGDSYSVQITKYRSEASAISQAYDLLRSLVAEVWPQTPPHGALWAAIYPNVMMEWYPLMLIISTVVPTGPTTCRNVVEYYLPKQLSQRRAEIFAAQQAAYKETAIEDAEICLTMNDGYYIDFSKSRDDRGPDHPHLEKGIIEFHNWLKKNANPTLSTGFR